MNDRDEGDGAGAREDADDDVAAAVPGRGAARSRAERSGWDHSRRSLVRRRRETRLTGRVSDGAEGARTPDLLAASQTLSQLSYGPASFDCR